MTGLQGLPAMGAALLTVGPGTQSLCTVVNNVDVMLTLTYLIKLNNNINEMLSERRDSVTFKMNLCF